LLLGKRLELENAGGCVEIGYSACKKIDLPLRHLVDNGEFFLFSRKKGGCL
jgi:hypothetical protein